MPGQRDRSHADRPRHPVRPEPDPRDLEARNEATGRGPGEEPRNIRKAGGGVRGASQGGAHTGRYAGSPAKARSNREPKPRGHDKGR